MKNRVDTIRLMFPTQAYIHMFFSIYPQPVNRRHLSTQVLLLGAIRTP